MKRLALLLMLLPAVLNAQVPLRVWHIYSTAYSETTSVVAHNAMDSIDAHLANIGRLFDSLITHRKNIDTLFQYKGVGGSGADYVARDSITAHMAILLHLYDSLSTHRSNMIKANDTLRVHRANIDTLFKYKGTGSGTDQLARDSITAHMAIFFHLYDSLTTHRNNIVLAFDSIAAHRSRILALYDSTNAHRLQIFKNIDTLNAHRTKFLNVYDSLFTHRSNTTLLSDTIAAHRSKFLHVYDSLTTHRTLLIRHNDSLMAHQAVLLHLFDSLTTHRTLLIRANDSIVSLRSSINALYGFIKLNSAADDGFVLKGTGQVNLVWKTDASGVPAWREDAIGGAGTLDGQNADSVMGKKINSVPWQDSYVLKYFASGDSLGWGLAAAGDTTDRATRTYVQFNFATKDTTNALRSSIMLIDQRMKDSLAAIVNRDILAQDSLRAHKDRIWALYDTALTHRSWIYKNIDSLTAHKNQIWALYDTTLTHRLWIFKNLDSLAAHRTKFLHVYDSLGAIVTRDIKAQDTLAAHKTKFLHIYDSLTVHRNNLILANDSIRAHQAVLLHLYDSLTTHRNLIIAINDTNVAQRLQILALHTRIDNLRLDQINNLGANKTFDLSNYSLVFQVAAPSSPGFDLNVTGNLAGDAMHIHQHTGNPTATSRLLYIETTDADIMPFQIQSANDTAAIIKGGVLFVDSLNVAGDFSYNGMHFHKGTPAIGKVLKWNGAEWTFANDSTGGGSGTNTDSLLGSPMDTTGMALAISQGDSVIFIRGSSNVWRWQRAVRWDTTGRYDYSVVYWDSVSRSVKSRQEIYPWAIDIDSSCVYTGQTMAMFRTFRPIQIDSVYAVGSATCNWNYNIHYGQSRATVIDSVFDAVKTISSTTYGDNVKADDGDIPAGYYVWIKVFAWTTKPPETSICLRWRYVR